MCKGFAPLPASCLERAKEVGTRLGILLLKSESTGSRIERKTRIPGRSHADEAIKWGESLDILLDHKRGVAAFRAFLRSKFSEEIIDFWVACEEYKNAKAGSKLPLKAQKIYDAFVKVQAPKESPSRASAEASKEAAARHSGQKDDRRAGVVPLAKPT
ncbi:regulator of G-protein signaling 4-like [Scyliorhinus canicula]|uniref:regulator of G-protein signaling 4-like n=1 Tax=Scyliorhinus canicula TaxID=7830 RepID=UPI0018F50591|nr:regulator of G-protein signaling 4-like [Scyliorhinus canicula]